LKNIRILSKIILELLFGVCYLVFNETIDLGREDLTRHITNLGIVVIDFIFKWMVDMVNDVEVI